MFKMIAINPVLNSDVRALCRLPYPNHKKGCPNYGVKPTCPPQAKYLFEVLDIQKPIYVIFNIFNLGAHIKRMKAKHPNWSYRQLSCCLYWQNGARKQLRIKVEHALTFKKDYIALYCPEACGVNITETMKILGHKLEWPPLTKTYQVALIGAPNER